MGTKHNSSILFFVNPKWYTTNKKNYTRYFFTLSSRKNNNNIPETRDLTIIEQFQYFPIGLSKLYNDFITYININDAFYCNNINAWSADSNKINNELKIPKYISNKKKIL